MPGARGPVPVSGSPQQGAHGGSSSSNTSNDLSREILAAVDDNGPVATKDAFPTVGQAEIKAALDRLASRQMVSYETHDTDVVHLTDEGALICREGSHEYKVLEAVRRKGGRLAIRSLPAEVGAECAKVGQGNALRSKWIGKDGDSFVATAEDVQDVARQLLEKIQARQGTESIDGKVLADLRRRKLVTTSKSASYTVSRGPSFAREISVEETDLTAEMLASGAWKTAKFKGYNFRALGAAQQAGALHPLMKVRAEFRNIFFSQGFVEMPTGRFVESGFWNFDALFVPQQHPARDLQDTFYIADPARADRPRVDRDSEQAMAEMEAGMQRLYGRGAPAADARGQQDYGQYWRAVQAVHEGGVFGSAGYRYGWSADEAERLVLRTHTTAVSAWALHRLAARPGPARYFSIDRVFRNETVDATHLAEFHQVEGVIADEGLTLGGLMRFLEDFFGRMGLTRLRFKPAYNPYTEPSMEIFGYHAGLARWVEIGNSGMFRPEMLEPMGLPPALRVYGFGLSLERPTMIKYGVSNIRDLLGHRVDLAFIKSNAAVRLDKD